MNAPYGSNSWDLPPLQQRRMDAHREADCVPVRPLIPLRAPDHQELADVVVGVRAQLVPPVLVFDSD